MTLRDYSYILLEEIRNAHIVDDERIDLRLIDTFINQTRADLISSDNNMSAHDEDLRQTMWVDIILDSTNHTPPILVSDSTLPTFISNRNGPLIDEIRGENHMAYPFTVVPFDRIRWAGNGRFNGNNIFVSMHGKKLYLSSRNDMFRVISKVKIEGIFNEPLDVLDDSGDHQLTPTTGTYPINSNLFNKIKEKVLKMDISFMLQTQSDEINDSTGEIIGQ